MGDNRIDSLASRLALVEAALRRLLEASSVSESDCAYDQGEQDKAHEQARAALNPDTEQGTKP